jgi:outer membrane protein
MQKRYLLFLCPLLLSSCVRDAADPLALAPATPYSTWKPMEGNRMVSSKYCETLLPAHFDEGELTLSDLIDIALQNNPSTKRTWSMARASAAQYGQSLSSFFPSINFSSFYFRQKAGFPETGVPTLDAGDPTTISAGSMTSQSVVMNYFSEGGPDLQLSYTLFDFGQRSAAALAAREALYYADLNHNQQIQSVLQTVMTDYYSYLYQTSLLKANEDNLFSAQTVLDSANEKFSLGLASLGDVAQARTQFLQSKIILTTQRQAVENAFALLATDLGLPAHLPFKVQSMPTQISVDLSMLEGINTLVERAQENRQDFLAMQANWRSKEASLLRAKRAVFPTIGTQMGTGRYGFNGGIFEPENHWSATLTLSFPIFNGFSYRNQIKNAEANVELAKAQMLQTELSIIQNVTSAHTAVKAAAQNLSDTAEYLDAAETEFKITLASYKAGTMTILDLLSAQSSLSDARSKKAGAQKDWFLSLANIAYATGALCSTPTGDSCQ